MNRIAIFCKSYRPDLERAAQFVESVHRFNSESLPLYLTVPAEDLAAFQARIGSDVEWLADEDIIGLNPAIDPADYAATPGHISQQVVKAEFWRTGVAQNLLCVDSDSRFIREFSSDDFLAADGTPYTVMHEDHGFREFCRAVRLPEAEAAFVAMVQDMQAVFDRRGPYYNYNPFPVMWSKAVWEALAERLDSQGKNILAELRAHPYESSWYGEALLSTRAIDLYPRGPLFKAYLYLEQYEHDLRAGLDEASLADLYLGVVYQSNWYPKRLRMGKRLAYKAKRRLRVLRRQV